MRASLIAKAFVSLLTVQARISATTSSAEAKRSETNHMWEQKEIVNKITYGVPSKIGEERENGIVQNPHKYDLQMTEPSWSQAQLLESLIWDAQESNRLPLRYIKPHFDCIGVWVMVKLRKDYEPLICPSSKFMSDLHRKISKVATKSVKLPPFCGGS